jgi:hypothetical protein
VVDFWSIQAKIILKNAHLNRIEWPCRLIFVDSSTNMQISLQNQHSQSGSKPFQAGFSKTKRPPGQ